MNIVFYWLTMGPYHIERMRALALNKNVSKLTVFQAAPIDDHNWTLALEELPFEVINLTNRPLSRTTELIAFRSLKFKLKKIEHEIDVFVNGAGFTNLFLNHTLSRFSFKSFLWSESTAIDNPPSIVKTWLKEKALKKYDAAIVAGNPHRDYLQLLGFNKPITIVGNVVGEQQVTKNGLKKEKIILFVGRFIPQKNGTLLIAAFKRISAETKMGWKLIMLGDGAEMEIWKSVAEGQINSDILFPGSQFGHELQTFYDRAAIFVLPSLSEPWGLVVNEALQSNCSVIVSSNCGCVPDLVENGKTGIVFNNNDVADLAHKLEMLMRSEAERNRLSTAGLLRMKDFSPGHYAEKCVNAFQQ